MSRVGLHIIIHYSYYSLGLSLTCFRSLKIHTGRCLEEHGELVWVDYPTINWDIMRKKKT